MGRHRVCSIPIIGQYPLLLGPNLPKTCEIMKAFDSLACTVNV
jgi:hypothetical protein